MWGCAEKALVLFNGIDLTMLSVSGGEGSGTCADRPNLPSLEVTSSLICEYKEQQLALFPDYESNILNIKEQRRRGKNCSTCHRYLVEFSPVYVVSRSWAHTIHTIWDRYFTFTINIFCYYLNKYIVTENYTIIYLTNFLIQGINFFNLLLLLKTKYYKDNFERRFIMIFQIISLEHK